MSSPADFTAAMATVNADIMALPSIKGATIPQLTQLATDVAAAQAIAQDLADSSDVGLDTTGAPGNFGAGADPDVLAADLSAMSADADLLANAFAASNVLAKLGKSIAAVLTG